MPNRSITTTASCVSRPDIDVVVVSSPDHWHHAHALAALKAGKDVYLEKPMTYTVDEAKDITEAVKAGGRVLQVGSPYASMDHFWKARQAIADGLIGQVVWASGGFGRNRNKRGEWNYPIDPDATEKTLDWKAFLGSAPKRPFTPERYSAGASTGTTPAASRPTCFTTRCRRCS